MPASVLGRAAIPDDLQLELLEPADLPRNWFDPKPSPALQEIGDDWLRRGRTAVFKVPSAVVREEWSYLLNPRHADFTKLVIGVPEPYRFDRMNSCTDG